MDGTGGVMRIASLNAISVMERRSRPFIRKRPGRRALACEFLANPPLPIRMRCQPVNPGGQGRGQGIIGRHDEEAHVIGDVLRGKQGTILMGGLAKMREQIRAAAFPPGGDLPLR